MYYMQSFIRQAIGATAEAVAPPLAQEGEDAVSAKRTPMGKAERHRLIQTVIQQREVATQR